MSKFNYKTIIKNKLFRPMIIIYATLSVALYLYIPAQMDQVIEDFTKKDALELIFFLEASKMYYNDFIIDDIQSHEGSAKPFTFKAAHKEKIGVLPLPAIFLEDLSKMANPERITRLYSDYPFRNRKDRILTAAQKRILKTISTKKDGIIMEKTTIDGIDYTRVAKANYMTHDACVKCHNNHEDRMWENDRWKLGEMRGVLETLTPVDKTVHNQLNHIRNNIVFFVLLSFFIMTTYYGYIIMKREDELGLLNSDLEFEYSEASKKVTLKNLALQHNISSMFLDFDTSVIYSKTNLFGILTDVSSAFCKISDYSREELLDNSHNIIRHDDMSKEFFKELWETIDAGKIWQGDVKNRKKDGGFYWVRTIISPSFDIDGIKTGYTSIRQDITKEKLHQLNSLKMKLRGNRSTDIED